ncbi:MAG: SbcC/MukB-like Walker B domain-containing protein, partial [Candidatus Binatia bacterium]
EKQRQEIEAGHLGQELQEAAREEKRVNKAVEEARASVQMVEQKVQTRQDAVTQGEQQEQAAVSALEENRRRHEAEHLRGTLHIGDPCPVCGTPVRELSPLSPETRGDLIALQRTADAAKATLVSARQALQKEHTAAAAACARKEAAERELTQREQKVRGAQEQFVTRFPGFSSLATALSALQSRRQELAATRQNLDAAVQAAEKARQILLQQRQKAQQDEATLTEKLRGVAQGLDNTQKQLAALTQLLVPFLSTGGDPEAVLTIRRQSLLQAQAEVQTLEQACHEAEKIHRSFTTRQMQKEADLRVLTTEYEAIKTRAEREARTVRESLGLPPESALPDLSMLEAELTAFAQMQEHHLRLSQREDASRREREEAERRVAELRADLQARERVLQETRRKLSDAALELERAQTDLRVEVAQSGLAETDADGEGQCGTLIAGLRERLASTRDQLSATRERRGRLAAEVAEQERRCVEKEQEEERLRTAETEGRLATDLHKLLGAEFTDFLSQGAVEALMRDASVHLQRLTHGRYSFDIAYKRKAIELQIVDHEDHRRTRPTHSLSGGETFLASLAIALALSQGFREVATGKAAKTSTECLILDEGFGTLDREGLQLVTETLQELRGEEGRMIGIITHVEEVAAAMPVRIEVHKGNRTSTVMVSG